jgi:2-haloacid dehalogenase
MLNFRYVEALTFDCYGTLIDWEDGILGVLGALRDAHGIGAGDDELLECYARAESHAEVRPYRRYNIVLRDVMRAIASHYGVADGFEEDALVDSLPRWRPFADTVASLAALKRRFKLGIISNVDDDLFAHSAGQLEVPFDWVVTAEQVGAYKPSQKVFRHALRLMGLPAARVVHVAQSRFHDIGPLCDMGWSSVWVNRRRGRSGPGATTAFSAEPTLEVPDLATLVRVVEHQLQTWDG